jgi:ribonuclease HI
MYDPHALKIYIDGSAFGNPGHEGGLAGIAEFPDITGRQPEIIFEQGYQETTNNRMELRACIRALEYVSDNAVPLGVLWAIVLSDSQYVVENHKRAPQWAAEKWRNRHGRPIENADLWRQFLSVRRKIRVRIDIGWNLGKSTPLLKSLDKLAKSAAKHTLRSKDAGYRPGKAARHLTGDRGAATLYPAANQEVIIRIYAHSLVGKAGCKVKFTIWSEVQNRFNEKFFVYSAEEDRAEIHRHHCYKAKFNDNPDYPIFQVVESLAKCPGS